MDGKCLISVIVLILLLEFAIAEAHSPPEHAKVYFMTNLMIHL